MNTSKPLANPQRLFDQPAGAPSLSADMSEKDRWHDPFGLAKPREQVDSELTRSERLELFHAACSALAKGEMPPLEAARFLGAVGLAWLQGGGSLERDHLKLSAPRGSHLTAEALWRLIADDDFENGIVQNQDRE